jgi:hypothetical protein
MDQGEPALYSFFAITISRHDYHLVPKGSAGLMAEASNKVQDRFFEEG